jgi:hypothetical protein
MGVSINRGQWLRYVLISASFGFALPAFAGIEAKTTYNLNNALTEAKTEYKKAPLDLDVKFKDKLWEQFAAKLKSMPLVGDIQTSDVEEKKTDPGTWADYMTVTRNFSAFVQINLQKPVTMLFAVEQSHQVCKNPSQSSKDTITSSCGDLNTTLQVKGPIAVYGTFETESNLDVTSLLQDKQRLSVVASRSYDKANLIVDSTLYIDSMQFEKSLLKFFDVFNVNGINKKKEDLTRQSIFLGVARVMRQSNERMLEL